MRKGRKKAEEEVPGFIQFEKGAPVWICYGDAVLSAWFPGLISIVSKNGLSIGVEVDEGIPTLLAGIDRRTLKQVVMLYWGKTHWECVHNIEHWHVKPRDPPAQRPKPKRTRAGHHIK